MKVGKYRFLIMPVVEQALENRAEAGILQRSVESVLNRFGAVMKDIPEWITTKGLAAELAHKGIFGYFYKKPTSLDIKISADLRELSALDANLWEQGYDFFTRRFMTKLPCLSLKFEIFKKISVPELLENHEHTQFASLERYRSLRYMKVDKNQEIMPDASDNSPVGTIDVYPCSYSHDAKYLRSEIDGMLLPRSISFGGVYRTIPDGYKVPYEPPAAVIRMYHRKKRGETSRGIRKVINRMKKTILSEAESEDLFRAERCLTEQRRRDSRELLESIKKQGDVFS